MECASSGLTGAADTADEELKTKGKLRACGEENAEGQTHAPIAFSEYERDSKQTGKQRETDQNSVS
jgi:hypothetical protein